MAVLTSTFKPIGGSNGRASCILSMAMVLELEEGEVSWRSCGGGIVFVAKVENSQQKQASRREQASDLASLFGVASLVEKRKRI
mmetsp:Transcript_4924/g.10870  ORF Transcript_4924/g.10870 Transcript_4924/m.10870 type:complete len:84 (-) Transcript_4924:36-287(-)